MGELAATEATNLRFWFRSRYKLPPTDPRYLNITDAEILLEYEMVLASEGKSLKECFNCSTTTHREQCPTCGVEISGDAEVDAVFEKVEKGEEVDLDALLRGAQWQTVQKGGGA